MAKRRPYDHRTAAKDAADRVNLRLVQTPGGKEKSEVTRRIHHTDDEKLDQAADTDEDNQRRWRRRHHVDA